MKDAVNALDNYLKSKTVHNTQRICFFMQELCNNEVLWIYLPKEEQQDFAQKCRNFEIFSQSINKTSWGRKQFEQWWNEGTVTPDPTVYNAPKPGAFPTDEEAPPEFPMIYTGIPYEERLEQRIQSLEDENKELRKDVNELRNLVNRVIKAL